MFSDLDRAVRGRLRTLSKDNADGVGRHLVMVGRLLDSQPELAYEHAQAAVRRAGRVDVVREAAGLAAYRTGRYAEALRELRTVRRLNGSSEHLAIMADCERGLGRPERALALAQEPEAATLDADATIELAMVVSGARLDLGQAEAAVAALSTPAVRAGTGLVAVRVAQARATALEAAGRGDDAAAELAPYTQEQLDQAAGDVELEDDVVSFDLSERDEDGEYDEDAAAAFGTTTSVGPEAGEPIDDVDEKAAEAEDDDADDNDEDAHDADDADEDADDDTDGGDGQRTVDTADVDTADVSNDDVGNDDRADVDTDTGDHTGDAGDEPAELGVGSVESPDGSDVDHDGASGDPIMADDDARGDEAEGGR